MSGMMTDSLRKSLEQVRLIPQSDLIAKIIPIHSTPDEIMPEEMPIVHDSVDK